MDAATPAGLSPRSRRAYWLEMVTTFFFAAALAPVEGGIISVFAKQTYTGVVPAAKLNFIVAFLAATPELANLLSFVWGSLSQGRKKIPLINALQVCTLVSVALIAIVPRSLMGLMVLLLLVLAARVCWSGIITLRPTVWRANYPPSGRSVIVGRFSAIQVMVIAALGAGLGYVLDVTEGAYRIAAPVLAVLGAAAVLATRRQRVRRENRVRREEIGHGSMLKPWQGPAVVWRVLSKDVWYARFMLCMFILGWANLMVTPLMVIVLKDRFEMGYFESILLVSSIPAMVMPAAIPMWARLLDRSHVVKFRSIHSWVFVAASLVMTIGVAAESWPVLLAASVIQGLAFAGGSIAWNLGHVDFAPVSQTSQYMATHVSLNGLRGLIAPFASVVLYQFLVKRTEYAAELLLTLCTIIGAGGAMGFVLLRIGMGKVASGMVSRA